MEFFSLEIREPDEGVLKMFTSIGSQIGQFVQRKQAETALQRSKELLEQRVRERTQELRTANKELKNEIERRKGLEGEILTVSTGNNSGWARSCMTGFVSTSPR